MAAYFIQYSYETYDGFIADTDCIIDYERFEKVNGESFNNKFRQKLKQKNTCKKVKIKNVIKL